MILFDTETTGFPKASAVSLDLQPRIIEFAAIKVDAKLKIIDQLEFLCNPGIPLEPIITKITGITDEKLKDQKPFGAYYEALCEFFIGESSMLAHNVDFDKTLLKFDLMRLGKECNFPWPWHHICTVEATFHLHNKRLKQQELFEIATGKPANQTHRALDDVMQLYTIVKWIKKQKIPL